MNMLSRCLKSEGEQVNYKRRRKQENEGEITEFGQVLGVRFRGKALLKPNSRNTHTHTYMRT